MLEQANCERILAIMSSHTIEQKVKAIEEARILFTRAFTEEMTPVQFAYSAMVLEQQYNLMREILQVKQIRIKADLAGGTVAKEPKSRAAKEPKEPKKAKPSYSMDMNKMESALEKYLAKKRAGESTNGDASSGPETSS